jgi:hypothetical protein
MKKLSIALGVLSLVVFFQACKKGPGASDEKGYVECMFNDTSCSLRFSIGAIYMKHDAMGDFNTLTIEARTDTKKVIDGYNYPDTVIQILVKGIGPLTTTTYTRNNNNAIIAKAALLIYDLNSGQIIPPVRTYACNDDSVEYNVQLTKFEPVVGGRVEGKFSFFGMEEWVSANDATVLSSGHRLTDGKFSVVLNE